MRAAPLFLLCALALGACSTAPGPKTDSYQVAATATEFYKYGPAQAFGPDSSLKRGEKITMVKRDFGFSQIRLADGTTGYAATEDLKPAPPPLMAARARTGARHVASRSSHVAPTPSDPLFDVTDIPLPLPDSKPEH